MRLAVAAVLVALSPLVLPSPASSASRHDSYPLHAGSAGPRVCAAQWLMGAHRPSVYRTDRFRLYRKQPTCVYTARTGRLVVELKRRLGYPTHALEPVFGRQLREILTGRRKRPSAWVVRATARATTGIVLRKAYPTSERRSLIGYPFGGTHTLGNWQSDNAVDIPCRPGSPVRAPITGRLFGGYGPLNLTASRFLGQRINIAGLYRARAVAFYLAHLSRLDVAAFAPVRAGQQVGICGPANGVYHLHIGASYGFPIVRFILGGY